MLSSKCPEIPQGLHYGLKDISGSEPLLSLIQCSSWILSALSQIFVWCWTMKTRWKLILSPKFLAKTKTKNKDFFFFQNTLTNLGNQASYITIAKTTSDAKLGKFFSLLFILHSTCYQSLLISKVTAVLQNAVCVLSCICLLFACVPGDSSSLFYQGFLKQHSCCKKILAPGVKFYSIALLCI